MRHLTPAQYLLRVLGGPAKTAQALSRNRSTVLRWAYPAGRGGMDGRIPHDVQGAILDLAERQGLDITAQDLIRGRDVPEAAEAEVA